MVEREQLLEYIDGLLEAQQFRDYCPNGLQVEGAERIDTLVGGVTASQALIDAAVTAGAQAILVHHGYFWRGEPAVLTGMRRRRIAALLGADLNLFAYHLPLDAHPQLGNNAQLANRLGLEARGRFGGDPPLAWHGRLSEAESPQRFGARLASALGRAPLHIDGGCARIETLGWCTGAAQDYIEQAAALNLDAFVSGEVSERTVHVARECGIHYFCAGHHATERYGVQALGTHLAERFALRFRFFDIDNPA